VGSPPLIEEHEDNLAQVLIGAGCEVRGAPYIVRRLIWSLDSNGDSDHKFVVNSPQRALLAAAFMDEKNCPGARGLSEEEKVRLANIRGRTSTSVPKLADQ
jgi:hypothetical protein